MSLEFTNDVYVRVFTCTFFKTLGGVIIRNDRKKDKQLINEEITAKTVLVIGPNGEQVGERSREAALTLAETAGLDLVLVAPDGKPPVCRVMNYGKYKYEQQRKTRDAKKNQKTVQLKEIRMTPVTDIHDIETKARNGKKFLEKGNKLKVSVFFRGRQMEHKDLGYKVLDSFFKIVEEVAEIEKPAKMEGRYMSMYLQPKK